MHGQTQRLLQLCHFASLSHNCWWMKILILKEVHCGTNHYYSLRFGSTSSCVFLQFVNQFSHKLFCILECNNCARITTNSLILILSTLLLYPFTQTLQNLQIQGPFILLPLLSLPLPLEWQYLAVVYCQLLSVTVSSC